MVNVLLLSNATEASSVVLPALSLLGHPVRVAPVQTSSVVDTDAGVVLLDARRDLVGARSLCRTLQTAGSPIPIIAVLTEGGLAAVSPEWGLADVVLVDAGPAEIDARIRLARQPVAEAVIAGGGIEIDDGAYTARLDGKAMELTYTEFELLKFFVTHPNRVFSREQLLSEVWGYDYYGGTRTVDVHVRRLRAKLGDADALITTVRNVGYRFAPR